MCDFRIKKNATSFIPLDSPKRFLAKKNGSRTSSLAPEEEKSPVSQENRDPNAMSLTMGSFGTVCTSPKHLVEISKMRKLEEAKR